ncbi:RNA polymerase sigma factor [Chitinophaga defluvii]|uniref:Sigma-70 family RNA polymerase sigma factor n=1 Tax=Chitinophaga defluvii TaxID=3163343 RepID=A0ABV2TAD5_9BACT
MLKGNTTENSDEDLWEHLLQSDQDALYQLYTRFYQPLLSFGLKYNTDADFVKDAINQLFLYLWEKRDGLQAARNVRNYLYTSLRRQLARQALQHSYVSTDLLDDAGQPFVPSREDSWIAEQEVAERSQLMATAINKLPARQRQLLFMKYYEMLSYEEMADKTGLTVRSIYNKVHEAIVRLRQDLEPSSPASGKPLLYSILLLLPWLF